jgi:hypothetical protein
MSWVCVHATVAPIGFEATVSNSLVLQWSGLSDTTVVVGALRHRPLPWWMYLASMFMPECPGHAELRYTIPAGVDTFRTSDVDFDAWEVRGVRLTHAIGMLPVRVRVVQGADVLVDLTIQRRRHCVHLHH